MKSVSRFLIGTVCVFGGGGAAQAQMNPGLQAMVIQHQFQGLVGRSATRSNRTSTKIKNTFSASSDSATSADTSLKLDLNYSPSKSRRRANLDRFVQKTRAMDPAGAAALAETFKSDPIALMEPELAKVGLRIDNVADAYAVYWVEAWQAVHGVSGASSRATAQAVRRQAADAILATPEFANATPVQKQEFAEALLVQALLVGAAKEQAQGNPAQLAKVAAAVEQGARATGLELRDMTLTETGFGPARKTGAVDPAPSVKPQVGGYGVLAIAGSAGLGAAFVLGKAMSRRGF